MPRTYQLPHVERLAGLLSTLLSLVMPRSPRCSQHSKSFDNLPLLLSVLALSLLLSSPASAEGRFAWQYAQEGSRTGKAPQAKKEERALEPGSTIERDLAGGESHLYWITLQAGEFLQAEVEQRGINVAVTLRGPGGEKLAVVDLQRGTLGIEPIWWEAEKGGTYQLESPLVDAEQRRPDLSERCDKSRAGCESHVWIGPS